MTRGHPLRDAGLALSLLTVMPTSSIWPENEHPQVAAWFPWVGALFGLLAYGIVHATGYLRITARTPYLVAALVVAIWALLTRLLHFDGLADVADAYWGSHDPARRLEIMADSRTGAFGATAVSLAIVLEVLAVGTLLAGPHETPVLLVPVLARFAATAAAWLGQPAKSGGLGASVAEKPSSLGFFIGMLPVLLVFIGFWAAFHAIGLVLAVFALVTAFAVPHVLARRFGGVTGDVMGASVILTEVVVFSAMALVL